MLKCDGRKRADRSGLFGALLVFSGLVFAPAMATEKSAGEPGRPPLEYRLNQLSLSIQVQPGHGLPSRLLSMSGHGSATLERGAKAARFEYPSASLVAVLNELHGMRFFEFFQPFQQFRNCYYFERTFFLPVFLDQVIQISYLFKTYFS